MTAARGGRVAVTGYGLVTPPAVGIDDFTAALREGRRRIYHLEGVPVPRGKSAVGRVTEPRFDGPDRGRRMAEAAIGEAMELAGWSGDADGGCETALLLSTIAGDSGTAESLYPRLRDARAAGGPVDGELARALRLFPNGALADALGERFALHGPRLVVTNACASGNIALGLALDLLRAGRVRRAVVVGVELAKLSMVWGAERSGFIGRDIRPFHADRDGSVLGDGAAAVVLEPADAGDPRVLGWLEGFGCVCDRGAAPITLLEDGSGLRRSMELALDDAGRERSDVEYVNAHAPGTPKIDQIECRAAADLVGGATAGVAINSTKALTTHLSGASAPAELIACLLQMRHGFLHPHPALDRPDPELALTPVGRTAVERAVRLSLSNACGGGGLNTTVALTPADRPAADDSPGDGSSGHDDAVVVTGTGGLEDTGELPVEHHFPDTDYGFMNRAAQIAAVAGALGLADAGIDAGVVDRYGDDRVAVVAGTWLGGGPEASEVLCRVLERRPEAMRPSMSLDHGLHLGAALVCRHFGLTGTTYTLTGNAVAGLQAAVVLADLLRAGRADAGVALGFDAADELTRFAFDRLDGCPGGEGLAGAGAALVLERDAAARARGARRHARLGTPRAFCADLATEAGREAAAARLAAGLDAPGITRLHLAAPPGERYADLAQRLVRLLSAAGGDAVQLVPRRDGAGYALAGEAALALAAAATGGVPAAVLAAEGRGNLVLLPVEPVS